MPSCIQQRADGAFEPAAAGCMGTSLVVMTADEYAEYSASPFNLSAEDGTTVAWLIVGCWTAAFVVRALIKALHVGETREGERE